MKVLHARLAALFAGVVLTLTACGGGSSNPPVTTPVSTPASPAQPAPVKSGPDAPTGVAATAKNGMAYISFAASTSKDGSAVTGYTVRSNPPGGTDLNAGSTALGHLVAGLNNGTSYTFVVTAASATVVSADSNPSNPVTLSAPTAASWSLVGSLAVPRLGHAAVLLKDGRVLVTGGRSAFGSDVNASAELYNPVTQTWTPAAPMSASRSEHTATLLSNGKVLVVGGAPTTGFVDNATTGQRIPLSVVAELYDPATNTWAPVATDVSRAYHSATLLPNGKVLIVGGYNETQAAMPDVDLYDPATNALAHVAKMAAGRRAHWAMLLPSGKVFVFGGSADGFNTSASERYDPETGFWTTVSGPGPNALDGGTATLLPNGKILTVTGARYLTYCSLYDPETLVRTDIGSINTGSSAVTGQSSAAILLGNGKVLLVGGSSWSGLTTAYYGVTNAATLFDPATNAWSSANVMPQGGRTRPTIVALRDGSVLVTGGENSPNISSAVSLYVPAASP